MTITANASIKELQARMGDATEADAEAMLEILIEAGYEGQETSDIPESAWLKMLNKAAQ